jgi:D-3-phosphoglycerate dehydrogenase
VIPLVDQADAVITQFAPVTAEVISKMEKAKVIVRYGIGVDNVDLRAAKERGIPVCNVPEFCIDEVIVASHIASASPKAAKALRETASQIAATALRGEPLRNIVSGVSQ